MQDWNDLYYFAQAVNHGGFAAAGRALNQPKSKLSRRVAQLEDRLGVRLIERSSRRFLLTEIGQGFYESCKSMLSEAERAEAVVAQVHREPAGYVLMSCPIGFAGHLSETLPGFLKRYPQIKLQVMITNRFVDLHEERIDVSVRMRTTQENDESLTALGLGKVRRILVASPEMAAQLSGINHVAELAQVPTVSMTNAGRYDAWRFISPEGAEVEFKHEPRFACTDQQALINAVSAGIGVGLMLDYVCAKEIENGTLVRLLPAWQAVIGNVYLVHRGRRGLSPAVRALVDFLASLFDEPFIQ
ncbi:MAG: LysR family transcriptional regulator [Pseudomonas sp.]|nr:LysR family transcriptional regulator [Pseudomonas sp.]